MGDNKATSIGEEKESDTEKRTYRIDRNVIEGLDIITSRYYGDGSKGYLINVALCRLLVKLLDIDRDIELINELIASENKWTMKLNELRAERIEQQQQQARS